LGGGILSGERGGTRVEELLQVRGFEGESCANFWTQDHLISLFFGLPQTPIEGEARKQRDRGS